jgi:hypothetical protein
VKRGGFVNCLGLLYSGFMERLPPKGAFTARIHRAATNFLLEHELKKWESPSTLRPGTVILPDTIKGALYVPGFDEEKLPESIEAADRMLQEIFDKLD